MTAVPTRRAAELVRVPAGADPEGAAAGGRSMDRRGGYDWRFVAAYPLPEHPGYVYWVVYDITPRRQMEQIMRAEQERRSEEHTTELQSPMRISYAVFCLTKNTTNSARCTV